MGRDRESRGQQPLPTPVRFGQRADLALAVTLRGDGSTEHPGIVRNASISGALIETSLELPLHANMVVTFSFDGTKGKEHRAVGARVMRIDPVGLGVEWQEMGGADVLALLERAS